MQESQKEKKAPSLRELSFVNSLTMEALDPALDPLQGVPLDPIDGIVQFELILTFLIFFIGVILTYIIVQFELVLIS